MKSIIIVLFSLFGFGLTFSYGPCPNPPVKTVAVDETKWAHDLYVNLVPKGYQLSCFHVKRQLEKDGSQFVLAETTSSKQKGVTGGGNIAAKYISKGHYEYKKVISAEKSIALQAYFLLHDSPNLDMHYVCSDDPMFAKVTTPAIFVESRFPDAPKRYARKIKAVLKKNGFNPYDLEIVNNCNCDNIPYPFGKCKSKVPNVEAFFSH